MSSGLQGAGSQYSGSAASEVPGGEGEPHRSVRGGEQHRGGLMEPPPNNIGVGGGDGQVLRAGAGGMGGQPFRARGMDEQPPLRAGGGGGGIEQPHRAGGGGEQLYRADEQHPRRDEQQPGAGGGDDHRAGGEQPRGGSVGVARVGQAQVGAPLVLVGADLSDDESEEEEEDADNIHLVNQPQHDNIPPQHVNIRRNPAAPVVGLAIYRRTWNSFCTFKVQCCGLLTITVMVALVAAPVVGLTLMYTQQKSKMVSMYTSTTEAYQIYDSTETELMRTVCMRVPHSTRTDRIDWVLYTSHCNGPGYSLGHQDYYISGTQDLDITQTGRKDKGYYFYFLANSYITPILPNESGSVQYKYLHTKSSEKAFTLYNYDYCSDHGKELPPVFDSSGYYYVCVIATKSSVNFKLHVYEIFYNISVLSRNECTDTISEQNSHLECCHFSQKSALAPNSNCVYISATNTTPTSIMSSPPRIEVRLSYDDSMKTFLIAFLVVVLCGTLAVLGITYFARVQLLRRQHQP